MQNQNVHPWSWGQGPAPGFPGTQPILPTAFPPPGLDQNSLLSGYQQMFGSPPGQQPPNYNQWTTAQLQQWQQWQQWQEKYQQWQAQYGKKYAESLAALGHSPGLVISGVPPVVGVPKPVEPVTGGSSNPPLPTNTQPVPPPPPDEEKPPLPYSAGGECGGSSLTSGRTSSENPEELSEAEKTFDIQFKQWEGQFNEWKKQNQDHPDKAQYREYEKKWETWREQLLQRREQMRKKRLNKSTESSNDGKGEDSRPKPVPPPAMSKLGDSDYNYKTQGVPGQVPAPVPLPTSGPVPVPVPEPLAQGPPASDPSKFENKLPFFEKPQDVQSRPSLLGTFSESGVFNQGKGTNQPPFNSNNFLNYGPDKMDGGRHTSGTPFQNSVRNQGLNYDGGQNKVGLTPVLGPNSGPGPIPGLGSGPRFGNIDTEYKPNDSNFNSKFRNCGFEGPRFGGNYNNFGPRPRFGVGDERNFCLPPRFTGDGFRNERDNFHQQRGFFDGNRDKDLGCSFPPLDNAGGLGRGGSRNDLNDFRSVNHPDQYKSMQNTLSKSKVPSLFDITVEKPPGLSGLNHDRKPKIWDKYEKDDYFDDPFEKRQQEEREGNRNQKPWANSGAWSKNVHSPWMQPWEMERLASQKAQEAKPWDRGPKADNRPWLKDGLNQKSELDKAELSGYVGNILAKLGSFNVMPPNSNKSENFEENVAARSDEVNIEESSDWNKGPGQRNKDEEQNLSSNMHPDQSGDSDLRQLNRGGPNLSAPGAKDFDQRVSDTSDKFPPSNFDHLNESKKDTDERVRFEGELQKFDVDERMAGRDERLPFRGHDRSPFGRDFARSREDQRNEDRFLVREERGFGRPGRDDRGFGRFNACDDIDERFNSRNGRKGFDRFNDRGGRFFDRPGGPFDRFARGRDQNEPVWNPQVFDYSQGRAQKVEDSEDNFKISTVVDYSHGENRQTFDYGHGAAEVSKEDLEIRSFDYGHKTESLSVIDYGHGVDTDLLSKDFRRDRPSRSEGGDQDVDERTKPNLGTETPGKRRSRSPKGRHRSHSRSPHSRFKREHNSPTPFRGGHKNRERLGKHFFKRDRGESENKPLCEGEGDVSKHSFDVTTVLVEDLICLPGRESRPNKLVFIMRGIPGSGKTYVTKLIKDKEIELGGDPPRILSLDDYFMTEVEKEITDKETGRKVKTKILEYEYEAGMEPHYRGSLLKAFKKTISDGFFSFIVVDSINEKTKDYEEMWSFAKQKGFQVYVAEMDNDLTVCKGRNIHKRTEKEMSDLIKVWEPTPQHYLRLDVRSLLQSDAITEVEMEVVSDTELEKTLEPEEGADSEKNGQEDGEGDGDKKEKDDEDEDEPGVSAFVKSRWDQFENSEQNLDRLDGLKRRREGFHGTMEEYLQLPDDLDLQANNSAPGKKRVRWADLEERRQQEKMRAIGFVVGQTDWNRMTDPTFGENALTRTKYI